MCSIDEYCSRIGSFSSRLASFSWRRSPKRRVGVPINGIALNVRHIPVIVLLLSLVMCGDVEQNPGPPQTRSWTTSAAGTVLLKLSCGLLVSWLALLVFWSPGLLVSSLCLLGSWSFVPCYPPSPKTVFWSPGLLVSSLCLLVSWWSVPCYTPSPPPKYVLVSWSLG